MNVEMNAEHWFHQGGFVMYVLAIFSIVVVAVTLEKIFYMSKIGRRLDELKNATKSKTGESFKGLESDPLFPLYSRLQEIVEKKLPIDDSLRFLDRAIKRFENHLSRGIGWLATIGNTAPFVGLFGTVLGIIRAFRSLSGGDPASYGNVSEGIAEALIATASGLVVAIPSVILYNLLVRRINNLTIKVRLDAEDFLEELIQENS